MMTQFGRTAVVLVGTVVALLAIGCGPGGTPTGDDGAPPAAHSEHDHDGEHQHDGEGEHKKDAASPADFPAGVAALKEHYEKIRDAFQAGKTEDAHTPLHSVGHLMEALPGLATEADLAEKDVATVKTAIEQMFGAYGAVDDAMHEGKEPDYAAVSEKLDESMAKIEGVLKTVAVEKSK